MLQPKGTRWASAVGELCAVWAAGWALEHREQAVQGHSWPFIWHIWEQDAQPWALVLDFSPACNPFLTAWATEGQKLCFCNMHKMWWCQFRWCVRGDTGRQWALPCSQDFESLPCSVPWGRRARLNLLMLPHTSISLLWHSPGLDRILLPKERGKLGWKHMLNQCAYPAINGAYFLQKLFLMFHWSDFGCSYFFVFEGRWGHELWVSLKIGPQALTLVCACEWVCAHVCNVRTQTWMLCVHRISIILLFESQSMLSWCTVSFGFCPLE